MTTREEAIKQLLPSKPGQARVMTIASGGDPVEPDAGHWYSPDAVAEMVNAVKEQTREKCAELVENNYKIYWGEQIATDIRAMED